MDDFLTRLAAKTLGMASVVRPFIAPAFAASRPAIQNDAPGLRPEIEAIQRQTRPEQATSSRSRNNGAHQVEIEPEPAPRKLAPNTNHRTENRENEPAHAADMSKRPEAFFQPVADDRKQKQANFSSAVRRKISGLPEQVSERRPAGSAQKAEDRPSKTRTPAPTPMTITPEKSVKETEIQNYSSRPSSRIPEERSRYDDQMPLVPPEVVAIVAEDPPEMTGMRPMAPDKDSRRQPSEPRRVKVSIGRVEVKAIMPPEPPSVPTQPAPRGPALSLDAYLEQRKKG